MTSKSVKPTHILIILMIERFGQITGSPGMGQVMQQDSDILIKHISILNGKMEL